MKLLNQSWLGLSCLQLSGALSLPIMMIGYLLSSHFTLLECLLQIVIGNLILLVFSCIYMKAIVDKQWITLEFSHYLFGNKGGLICGVSMIIGLVGWSAVQLRLISLAFGQHTLASLALAIGMYFLTYKDLSYLIKANRLLLPILLVSLAFFIINQNWHLSPAIVVNTRPFRVGLMLIISTAIGLVFDLPTFFRHSKSSKDAYLSLALIFCVFLPFIEGLGIMLQRYSSISNPASMWLTDFLHLFNLPLLLFLMSSTLLGACLNIYSASLTLARLSGVSYRFILVGLCIITFFLSHLNFEKGMRELVENISVGTSIILAMIINHLILNKFQLNSLSTRNQHQYLFILLGTIVYACISQVIQFSLLGDLLMDVSVLVSLSFISITIINHINETSYENIIRP